MQNDLMLSQVLKWTLGLTLALTWCPTPGFAGACSA